MHGMLKGTIFCRSVSALKETYGAEAVAEAGLAILEQQFPAYSRPALKEMLEAANCDVASALDSMSFVEAEHSNHRAANKPEKAQVLLLLPTKLSPYYDDLSMIERHVSKSEHLFLC